MEFSSDDERLKKFPTAILSGIDKVFYESRMELSINLTRERWRMFQFGFTEQVIRSADLEQDAVDWFNDRLFSVVNTFLF